MGVILLIKHKNRVNRFQGLGVLFLIKQLHIILETARGNVRIRLLEELCSHACNFFPESFFFPLLLS